MTEYEPPYIPIPNALVPLQEQSGSAILSFGSTIIHNESVPYFCVAHDSPLLEVTKAGDAEPTWDPVVRHGDWLAVSDALSTKPNGEAAEDIEAIRAFISNETTEAITTLARMMTLVHRLFGHHLHHNLK